MSAAKVENDTPTLQRPRAPTPYDAGLILLSALGAVAVAMGLVLLIVVVFPKASPEEQAIAAESSAKGETLFKTTCGACHGQEGKGVPGLGKDMTTSAFVTGLDDAGLVDFIKVGRTADDPANTTKVPMPAMGGNPNLTDDELNAIVQHIRSL